jgi:hypothetical protein
MKSAMTFAQTLLPSAFAAFALLAIPAAAQAAPRDTAYLAAATCTGKPEEGREIRLMLMIDANYYCSSGKATTLGLLIESHDGGTEMDVETRSARVVFGKVNGVESMQLSSQTGASNGKFTMSELVTVPTANPSASSWSIVAKAAGEGTMKRQIKLQCIMPQRHVDCGPR